MRYIIGLMIIVVFSVFLFLIFLRYAVEVHRSTLKEVKKNGYKSFKEYKKDMEKKEYILIKKNRKRKKWNKYQERVRQNIDEGMM